MAMELGKNVSPPVRSAHLGIANSKLTTKGPGNYHEESRSNRPSHTCALDATGQNKFPWFWAWIHCVSQQCFWNPGTQKHLGGLRREAILTSTEHLRGVHSAAAEHIRTKNSGRCFSVCDGEEGLYSWMVIYDSSKNFTTPLPTGVRLDPTGDVIDLGSMPMGMALAPEKDKVVVILGGWREQGIQVIDLKSMRVTQTLQQEAAFYGISFSQDGRTVYASGGNDDSIFCYSWNGGTATFERKIVLGKQKPDKTGSRYPAGIAASRNGKLLYVAENVGDSLAVVNLDTSEVVQRIPTDHYPYAVELASNGKVYVSAWGGSTISVLRTHSDGTLLYERRIAVGRHQSALLTNRTGSRLFV